MTLEDRQFPDVGSSDDFAVPWARPAPWFLGNASVPMVEPEDEAGRGAMTAELAQLPFLKAVRHLIDFIGDGRRLTKQGELFAVDRRKVERLICGESVSRAWNPYPDSLLTHFAWNVLISEGWLVREEGWMRLAGAPLPHDGDGAFTEEALDGARRMIATALGSLVTTVESTRRSEEPDHNSLEALLVASGSDGLRLPVLPPDDELIHCAETVNLLVELIRLRRISDAPIDRRTGHVTVSALRELARVSNTMDRLDGMGLVHLGGPERDEGYDFAQYESVRQPVKVYRAPVVVRGAVAIVRDRLAPEGLGEGDEARRSVRLFMGL